MNHKRTIVSKCIHVILSRHCLPDGTIDRNKLFSVIAERISHIAIENKTELIKELKKDNIIIDENKFGFKVNMNLGYK
jgi:hypothetical protein